MVRGESHPKRSSSADGDRYRTLEFLRSSFSVHAVYFYLVLNWGDPTSLTVSIWYTPYNISPTRIKTELLTLLKLYRSRDVSVFRPNSLHRY